MPKRRKMDRQTFRLPERHRWKAKEGNQIFVANKGDVRFEFPSGWVFDRTSGGKGKSVRFYDGHPPNDNIRLEVSVLHIPDPRAFSAPLADVLNSSIGDIGDNCRRSEAFAMKLPRHDLALLDLEYIDPVEKRPAHSLFCLARGAGIHALISLDYWPEDSTVALAAWEDVLGSLCLGEYLEHPFFGPKETG